MEKKKGHKLRKHQRNSKKLEKNMQRPPVFANYDFSLISELQAELSMRKTCKGAVFYAKSVSVLPSVERER